MSLLPICGKTFETSPILFNRKLHKVSHLKLFFNKVQISQIKFHKHLGIVLNSKLTFHDQVDMVFTKIKRCLGLLCKAKSYLPRAALVTIFKTFIRPHGDVLYFKVLNSNFNLIQYMFSHNWSIHGYIERETLSRISFRVFSN